MILISRRWRGTLLWTGAFSLAAYLLTGGILDAAHLHFNCTDSVPIGIYRETGTNVGPYAAFCLPEGTWKTFSKKDISFVPGNCPGGFAPILKPVIQASPQAPVIFTKEGFLLHGKLCRNTVARAHMQSGAPLTHYPFSRYTEGLWVISDYNPNSYDSRYFGPVSEDTIRFYAKPFWTR